MKAFDGEPSARPPVGEMGMQNPIMNTSVSYTTEWRRSEVPAGNGHGSARGIAKLYGILAGNGSFSGESILSPETLDAMSEVVTAHDDLALGHNPKYGMGVMVNPNGVFGDDPNAIGHPGWGGSFGFASRARKLAVGYVCNHMQDALAETPYNRAANIVAAFAQTA
jgi:CubicO group peptidase (beta-lactamase class C family)